MTIIPVRPQRRKPDFTLTMINIVFLLLLFFLTTGSLTNRNEAQADIPLTKDLPLEKLPRPLLLITADGQFFLDGQKLSKDMLAAASKSALAATGNPASALNLLAQREMAASDFLDVAEMLRSSGVAVQIVTLHEAQAAGGAP